MNSPDPISKERPKMAALEAAAALPGPDPVPTVTYHSAGKTLIIGSAADVAPWAEGLCAQLDLAVLLTDPPLAVEPARLYTVHRGHKARVTGWLGAFDVTWEEGDVAGKGRFDLVLDLSPAPLIGKHQPPAGYYAPGADVAARALAVRQLAEMIGEFEKPKYFTYKERLCAHSRNRLIGCNACIDICSAQAIEGAGDRIKVNPNLCAGCGACTTVCPSGALGYAYPSAAYTGERLRTLVTTFREAGGGAPVLLFHSGEHGKALIGALESSTGVPANVIPVELHHTASVGIDVWLAAVAYGAGAVMVLMTDEEAPHYRTAVAAQMDIANIILNGLGYAGAHCRLLQASEPAPLGVLLTRPIDTVGVTEAAGFHVMADKRNTLDLALSHLLRVAPQKPAYVPLPAGAPFGVVKVATAKCSLCMACVGACPSSALMDSPTVPQLRFVEKNCVQCGLCETTCPEDAIVLEPRMSFADTWNKPVVLNESTPFCCIRCSKPIGTLQMIEAMLGKLGGHPAFAGKLDRLKMCGDCRVVDIMKSGDSARITGKPQ
ncbi:MAG TPA: 4Fe-4S dicluster domain-containing protein [Telluria sp.]|nr:4Fe-4S dicluster domain-containing protein [Telluria sp.]